MTERVCVAKIQDIPAGEARCIEWDGEQVALFNLGGKIYAIGDTCPHAGGPLSEGFVEDGHITCPWHGWSFTLDPDDKTPPSDMVTKYRVQLDGDSIYLEKLNDRPEE